MFLDFERSSPNLRNVINSNNIYEFFKNVGGPLSCANRPKHNPQRVHSVTCWGTNAKISSMHQEAPFLGSLMT